MSMQSRLRQKRSERDMRIEATRMQLRMPSQFLQESERQVP